MTDTWLSQPRPMHLILNRKRAVLDYTRLRMRYFNVLEYANKNAYIFHSIHCFVYSKESGKKYKYQTCESMCSVGNKLFSRGSDKRFQNNAISRIKHLLAAPSN